MRIITLQDIMQTRDFVQATLQKMATEGLVEAAAVEVKNLGWLIDVTTREAWLLTLKNVHPGTEQKLVDTLLHELELAGLGWEEWDIYTEYPDDKDSQG